MKRGGADPQLTVEIKKQEWELTLEGEPVLCCLMTRPECGGTWRGLEAINRYYARVAQVWQERWKREVYVRACLDLADRRAQGKPFHPWQASLTTQITYQSDGLLSLFQDGTEQAGHDRPVTARRGDTWSLETGAPLSLGWFLGKTRRWKGRVRKQMEEQAAQRLASGESLLDTDCRDKMRALFDVRRFYRTEQGIRMFFPMYALGPSVEGIPVFDIPLSAE